MSGPTDLSNQPPTASTLQPVQGCKLQGPVQFQRLGATAAGQAGAAHGNPNGSASPRPLVQLP